MFLLFIIIYNIVIKLDNEFFLYEFKIDNLIIFIIIFIKSRFDL